jgi:uncharacterized protein (DUF58 family)
MINTHERPAKLIARRYLFHAPGVTYAVTTVVLILGAINGQNNLLFAMFGLAVGGLIISGFLSGANLMGVRVSRLPSGGGVVGQQASIRYRIHNTNRWIPSCALLIEELETDRKRVARLGRSVGVAVHIAAGGASIVEASPECLKRGRGSLCRLRVSSTFPFGLTRKAVLFDGDDEIVIFPREPELESDPVVRSVGDRLSRNNSLPTRQGDEFHSLREYVTGDPLRNVAWWASARGGQLLVRQRTRRSTGRIVVEFESHADSEVQERIISCASALCARCSTLGYEFAPAPSGQPTLTSFGTGPTHLRSARTALALWEPRLNGTIGEAARPRDAARIIVGPGMASSGSISGILRLACDDAAVFAHGQQTEVVS